MVKDFIKPPANKEELIASLEQSIEKTKRKIAEYRFRGADASEIEAHLNILDFQLEMARRELAQKRGI